MDAEPVGAHKGLAGDLHYNAPVDGLCHSNFRALTPAQAARHG
jgi:hypothetical protein